MVTVPLPILVEITGFGKTLVFLLKLDTNNPAASEFSAWPSIEIFPVSPVVTLPLLKIAMP